MLVCLTITCLISLAQANALVRLTGGLTRILSLPKSRRSLPDYYLEPIFKYWTREHSRYVGRSKTIADLIENVEESKWIDKFISIHRDIKSILESPSAEAVKELKVDDAFRYQLRLLNELIVDGPKLSLDQKCKLPKHQLLLTSLVSLYDIDKHIRQTANNSTPLMSDDQAPQKHKNFYLFGSGYMTRLSRQCIDIVIKTLETYSNNNQQPEIRQLDRVIEPQFSLGQITGDKLYDIARKLDEFPSRGLKNIAQKTTIAANKNTDVTTTFVDNVCNKLVDDDASSAQMYILAKAFIPADVSTKPELSSNAKRVIEYTRLCLEEFIDDDEDSKN